MMIEDRYGRLRSEELIKPPSPPPMRIGDGLSKSSKLGFYLFMCAFCFGWGIFCGVRMAG